MYIDAATRNYRLLEVPVNHELRDSLKDKSLDELAARLREFKSIHNTTDTDTIDRAIRAIEIQEFYRNHLQSHDDVPEIKPLYLGIIYDRPTERERITQRLKNRLTEGLIEEVQSLLDSGITAESLAYYGLEYRFVTLYLTGKLDYNTMFQQLNTAIHQFAKRQRTWFRKMEREGCTIHWIDGNLTIEEKIDWASRAYISAHLCETQRKIR
jgi:tRNA dimethylallyltransferase